MKISFEMARWLKVEDWSEMWLLVKSPLKKFFNKKGKKGGNLQEL